MGDRARAYTDSKLNELEQELEREYARVGRKAIALFMVYMKLHGKKARELFAVYEQKRRSGTPEEAKEAEEEYKQELKNVTARQDYKKMAASIVALLVAADAEAHKRTNKFLPDIYVKNYNSLEVPVKLGYRFDLINEHTVRNLRFGDLKLLKDERWNQRRLKAQILQGILNGESIPKIAKRLEPMVNGNAEAAIRNARTAVTYAENQGRLDSMRAAEEELGLVYRKQWIATHDNRTRDSHLEVDGDIVDLDKPFVVGDSEMMCPGDPAGEPAEFFNCRCTMNRVLVGIKKEDGTIAPVRTDAPSRNYTPYRERNKNAD